MTQSRLLKVLLLAVAYFVTGKLGLLLAIPPGYATALWPPSGIALAALLLLGSEAWPGVLLGSFLVNISTTFDGSIARSLAVATAIGGAASAQALFGAFLIRRRVGLPLDLLRAPQIFKFLLLGGPVACVAAASVGVATLAINGTLQLSQIPFSWWTWWVGDVIGVLVVAPLVLIAYAEPREVWRRRAGPVALPLGLLLLLVTGIFILVSARERNRIDTQFEARAAGLVDAIQHRLQDSVDVLRTLEPSATPALDRKVFRKLVDAPLARHPFLQALSWNPRVLDADREAFEKESACPISERDAKERLVVAPRRGEYVPILYIEPYDANAKAVGFDVSSGIVRFEALKRACDSGQPCATRRIKLVQEDESSAGFLVFLPVFSGPAESRKNLAGYFACVVRLGEFFKPVEERARAEGLEVVVQEPDQLQGAGSFWQSSAQRTGGEPPGEFRREYAFAFAGRTWSVHVNATPAYVSSVRTWKPWGVLAAGMLLAGFVGAVLLAVTGRRILSERP